jgi:hypothetical protein
MWRLSARSASDRPSETYPNRALGPSGQRWWDVDDVFTLGDKLPGQQEPETIGRIDGPPSIRKVDRPFEEALDLVTICLGHR